MTLAIVKVFPLPVTPKSTWCLLPDLRPLTNFFIASGWSPVGLNLEESLNMCYALIMISFLEGTIEHLGDKYVILSTGGIGYRVILSPRVLNMVANRKPSVKTAGDPDHVEGKQKIRLYIHTQMNMREGTFDMYGFDKKADLDLFHLLTTVSGIGPKGAQNILSSVEPLHLKAAVVNQDADYLKKVSTLGPKVI